MRPQSFYLFALTLFSAAAHRHFLDCRCPCYLFIRDEKNSMKHYNTILTICKTTNKIPQITSPTSHDRRSECGMWPQCNLCLAISSKLSVSLLSSHRFTRVTASNNSISCNTAKPINESFFVLLKTIVSSHKHGGVLRNQHFHLRDVGFLTLVHSIFEIFFRFLISVRDVSAKNLCSCENNKTNIKSSILPGHSKQFYQTI